MKLSILKPLSLAAVGGLSSLMASSAMAQTMTSSKVEALVESMMDQPVSLLMGLPVSYSDINAYDNTGEMQSFTVQFIDAELMGEDVGTIGMDVSVRDADSLDLSIDLREMVSNFTEQNNTQSMAEVLRLDATINTDAMAYERILLNADQLKFVDSRNPDDNFFTIDGAIFLFDETEGNDLATLDFGVDGLVFSERGTEMLSLETIGMSMELLNTPDWFLHEQVNMGIQKFVMAQAGLISPMFAAADVLEALAPLLENDLQDLNGSFDIGQIQMKDLDVDSFRADLNFEGASFSGLYDHSATYDQTLGEIGTLTVDATDSWRDDFEPFQLMKFEGATLQAESQYSAGYDLRPLGALVRDIAADVRNMSEDDLIDPELALTGLYLRHAGPLLEWAIDQVESTSSVLNINRFDLLVPMGPEAVAMTVGGITLDSSLDITATGDVQSINASLNDFSLSTPDELSLTAGEMTLGYDIVDSLTVVRDVMNGLQDGAMTMGDGIRLALAVYLPNISIGASDLAIDFRPPGEDTTVSAMLASAGLSLTAHDMNSDQARYSQRVAMSGLDISIDGEVPAHPAIVDLILGSGDEPGLLPTDAEIVVELADLPMSMILGIADNVSLPPIEEMMSDDFDPTTLGLAGMALLSPILSSPPAVVVKPSQISGGLIQATAEGRVEVSPFTEPNRAIGSVVMRLSGVADVQAKVAQLMGELSQEDSRDAREAVEQLQQLMGLVGMASGFGIPTDDGALEFIIDVPAGAPANINGLPIPLNF